MPLKPTPLSVSCQQVSKYVKACFKADGMDDVEVLTGSPADALTVLPDKQRVNFFFHRFEASGLYPDSGPRDPWWMRAYALVTPFALGEDSVSAGENDLRLLGAVIRYLHETPVMSVLDDGGLEYRTQVIFHSVTLDELNRLWTTQKDTVYRPSVAYEVSLIPVIPDQREVPAPLVGAVGAEAIAALDRTRAFSGVARPPAVARREVDPAVPGWLPALCLVWGEPRRCAEALAFEVGSPALAAFSPRAWIAGVPASTVKLQWAQWEAGTGWTELALSADVAVKYAAIDPSAIPLPADLEPVSLPFENKAGQLLLVAVRTWTRPDGAAVTLKSNPVLVSLYVVQP